MLRTGLAILVGFTVSGAGLYCGWHHVVGYFVSILNTPKSAGIAMALGMAVTALPGIVVATIIMAFGRSAKDETRCRRCGYILRGLTEPRCSECGERI